MGSRYYDIFLPCGCMLSLDKGGGCIPCDGDSMFDDDDDPYHSDGTIKEKTKSEKQLLHEKSWKEYLGSEKHKEHQKEIKKRNQ